jgi:hypothetical protein
MEVGEPGSTQWYAVRCLFADVRSAQANRFLRRRRVIFEERTTLWMAGTHQEALAMAEDEAKEYARDTSCTYVEYADSYQLADDVVSGAEIFSLMRESRLNVDRYIDRFLDSGSERRST